MAVRIRRQTASGPISVAKRFFRAGGTEISFACVDAVPIRRPTARHCLDRADDRSATCLDLDTIRLWNGETGTHIFGLAGESVTSAKASKQRYTVSVRKGWDHGASEQPLTDRCLRRDRLPVICHPIEGEPIDTAEGFKTDYFSGMSHTPRRLGTILRLRVVSRCRNMRRCVRAIGNPCSSECRNTTRLRATTGESAIELRTLAIHFSLRDSPTRAIKQRVDYGDIRQPFCPLVYGPISVWQIDRYCC